jgi:catechol 2,3-dioxygenase-like lactoylglutathione lyase family enzyme
MLGQRNSIATIAVKDLPAARRFYEGKLGLEPTTQQGEQVVTYKTGSSLLNVYRSSFAGTNRATAVTWSLGDELESVVGALAKKGVAFEHYDIPQMTRQGDIHIGKGGEVKAAWFQDPDGNIISLVNGS